ncbi:MAG TPA: IS66 family transposase [Bryobacteraceae bacterium]|jgi:transposase|nr:IS66 family transposase [Bryobacteraceae bacterium]
MAHEAATDVPDELEQLRRRFEEFRNTQPVRSRLPEALWIAAAELAKRYGVHPTARTLRLDYTALPLEPDGYEKLKAAIRTLSYITELLENREATLQTLRRLLRQSSTEKTNEVLKQAGLDVNEKNHKPAGQRTEKITPSGHGRNGAAAYGGARKIQIRHAQLASGDQCPDCERGKVYLQHDPGVLVRIKGQAPIDATVYELERLRCNLCGKVFIAETPEGVGDQKYDATAASMIALLRYGSGFPWNRLEGLQDSLGIPLPAATQCEIVAETAAALQPAYEELIRQAAQGEVLHNDDTSMRVLALNKAQTHIADAASERTGVFTSGIVSIAPGRDIALFFTGRQHAGENLADVLKRRAAELTPPIQMCDALSRNLPKPPKALEIIVGDCLAHSRRRFVEVTHNFPEECRFVLETFREVYLNDALAREQNMTAEQRLAFHQTHSGQVMTQLRVWLKAQFDERKVEPNSGLGVAITYLLKHWDRLTLFLREPGAPLDNNIAERGLKKAILHRKNSLFYKTRNGARMGDLFMSLIHSCELCGANPLDYLTELQRHPAELKSKAADWMPWNYRDTIHRANANVNSG